MKLFEISNEEFEEYLNNLFTNSMWFEDFDIWEVAKTLENSHEYEGLSWDDRGYKFLNEHPMFKGWKTVDSYGGEGKGEEYWVVNYFPAVDKYARADAFYQSHHGTDDWSSIYVVVPKEKIVTVYEKP